MSNNAPSFDLSGRTALITGSTIGIGFAIAEALASAGANIVLNGIEDEADAQPSLDTLQSTGQK
ncbi:MAG: SDR family NAD(P)-dependent oxidoreductase, partial [Verrucomicrobiia bacterium]